MRTFETPDPISVRISLQAGSVYVRTIPDGATVVEVRPADPGSPADVAAAAAIRVDCTHDRLTVEGPRHRWWQAFGGGAAVAVHVDLPEGSRLELQGGAVEFECAGTFGETRVQLAAGGARIGSTQTLRADTASGDLVVDRVIGDLRVRSASANVRVGDVGGIVDVKSASGNVTLGQTGGTVRLIGASSDISVERALGSVGIKLASGNVRIGQAVRGSISLHAASGGLDLGIAQGTAARLDVTSGSGRVHSSLAATTGPEPADELLEVHVRTGSGDVSVRRA
ncbi:MAG TPA: DUF4097 family beta strand repeat-containing protein [Sporichthyaceae bacterium]|jgi:hypothetical protein|nr:DUF4097 family beta strand repeat-containing protein [Sporichthyaceae bacterium]